MSQAQVDSRADPPLGTHQAPHALPVPDSEDRLPACYLVLLYRWGDRGPETGDVPDSQHTRLTGWARTYLSPQRPGVWLADYCSAFLLPFGLTLPPPQTSRNPSSSGLLGPPGATSSMPSACQPAGEATGLAIM